MNAVLRTALIVLVALLLAACPEMFTNGMNNAVDPDAKGYQGYDTVANLDDIAAASETGAQWVVFTASAVGGATAYHMQVTTVADATFAAPLVNELAHTTNRMATAVDLSATATYIWRARAQKDGAWGAWSNTASVTFADATGMTPSGGSNTTDTTPELSWDAVTGTDHYEVQIASTAAGVPGATPVTVTAPDHAYTWPTALSDGDELHWRVKAVASDGTEGAWSAVAMVTFGVYEVGDTGPAGGIVFYDKGSYSDGWRYLEAAPADIDVSGDYTHVWGGYGTSVGGTGTAIGTGAANTAAIVAAYGSSDPHNHTGNYAARLCDIYEYGGYDDWFLASKDELNQMYQQKGVIGGFASGYYWSSSEGNSYDAWVQDFVNGYQGSDNEDSDLRVRACRAF